MNFLYRLIAIIYRTYDDRGMDIPHFRTLVTIIAILFLHLVQIGLLFTYPSNHVMPWSSNDSKGMQWIKSALYFLIPILLLTLIFNKKKLDTIPVTDSQINRGRIILPLYLIVSFASFICLLIRHGIVKGTIKF